MGKANHFPVPQFFTYVAYYSGQAVYNTYLNLYLTEIGFSASQIGAIISISTIGVLAAQMFWGYASDRTGRKAFIIRILYGVSLGSILMFYTTESYGVILCLVTIYSMFYVPIVPLNDNMTFEMMRGGKWDYGWIRAGGTVGYAVTVALVGFMLKNHYSQIFIIVAVSLAVCLTCSLFIPKLETARKTEEEERGEKNNFFSIFSDRLLVVLIIYYLVYGLGSNFYYSYYSIYFTEIGGTSALVGIMMFACSIMEVPCLIFMKKLEQKVGIGKILFAAGMLTALRWLLLGYLRNPILIIVCNLLHGFSFSAFTCCMLGYINRTVKYQFRTRAQVFNNVLSMVFSKFIFGYLGGLLYDGMGAPNVMYILGAITALAAIVFYGWIRGREGAVKA